MEGAVAGAHGHCGGVRCLATSWPGLTRPSTRSRDGETTWMPGTSPGMTTVYSTLAKSYRTTPDVNPALRRGGLISFFRKQRASRPV
ncbi:hypothetical protein ACVIWV_008391 [Bradyrhizobium diazoefficiens]